VLMKGFLNFFTFLGLGFLIVAGLVYNNGVAFRARSEMASGTVTGMSVSTNSDDITSYCPQIQFATRDGQQVTYFPNVCSTSPQFETGDRVELYYDPLDPEEAQIMGFWTQYGIVTLLGIIGLVFFAVGIIIGWLASPMARKKK
jgi:hypothetical protein